jgi:hypothetical protein
MPLRPTYPSPFGRADASTRIPPIGGFPTIELRGDGVERGARLQVDERRGISLSERQADVGALPGVSAGQRGRLQRKK